MQSFTRRIADGALTHRSRTFCQSCQRIDVHLHLKCRDHFLHHEQVRSHSNSVKSRTLSDKTQQLMFQARESPSCSRLHTAAAWAILSSAGFLELSLWCLFILCSSGSFKSVFLCSTRTLDKHPVLCQSSRVPFVSNLSMLCKGRTASLSSYERLCSNGKGSHQLSLHSQAQRFVSLSGISIYTVHLTPEAFRLYLCA